MNNGNDDVTVICKFLEYAGVLPNDERAMTIVTMRAYLRMDLSL